MTLPQGVQEGFKSGFASLVGRPNVGKSTLLNQLVHSKVAIVSNKPQTTRHAIRGVVTLDDAQVVFIDTPGLHKPQHLLGQHLNDIVHRTLSEVDVVIAVLDASQPFGSGDRFVAERATGSGTPAICVINKADRVDPGRLLEQMEAAGKIAGWAAIVTTSATRGTGLDHLLQEVVQRIPEGPMFYPADAVSDQPEQLVIAELIREKVLQLTREEVPHSVAVVIEEMGRRENSDLIDIYANIYAERDSQKAILIGHGGKMLKEIGSRARHEIEALLGDHVYLDVRIKVEPHWRRDERILQRFGY